MADVSPEPIATFCGECDCGCPQLFLDPGAPEDKRVRITDDFGQQVQMSAEQFADLVAQAKAGALDRLTVAAG
ncbi:hypothetical protein [Streptomyces phaeochromogenes]|uniref:hypothetical protein n=1 Tax=Streptomyces phaeochromogenes TaxID=1923 RepID=UPI0006E2F530|nr:hypothetical protein [Streptomyces phaeochromogenes]WSW20985.1 hypothetical protein OG277_52975 [Streptomyces phaeochromogenes]WTA09921.1 hypothetical protein OHB08_50775 [Streptomyces phaeochromogenes]